jgi:hypothetical protein
MYARISSKQAWNTEEFWGQKMVTLIPKACRRIFFSLDQNIPRRFVHLQHTSSHGDKDNRPWCRNFLNLMTEGKIMFYGKKTHTLHMWNWNNHMWYYHMWITCEIPITTCDITTCEIPITTCDITTPDSHVKLEQPHVILPHVIHIWMWNWNDHMWYYHI